MSLKQRLQEIQGERSVAGQGYIHEETVVEIGDREITIARNSYVCFPPVNAKRRRSWNSAIIYYEREKDGLPASGPVIHVRPKGSDDYTLAYLPVRSTRPARGYAGASQRGSGTE